MIYLIFFDIRLDIKKPATRTESPFSDSFYSDSQLKKMDIRVVDMAYYHGQQKKLMDDIEQVFCLKQISYYKFFSSV